MLLLLLLRQKVVLLVVVMGELLGLDVEVVGRIVAKLWM